MKINKLLILSIVLVSVSALSCKPEQFRDRYTSSSGTDPSSGRDQELDQSFNGSYSSQCTNESGSGDLRSADGKFTIQGSLMSAQINWYSTITCSGSVIAKIKKQTNLVKIKEYKGGTVFDGKLTSASMTLYVDSLIKLFNNNSRYGYSNWEIDVEQDITSQLRKEESNDGNYSLLKLDGSTLYINSYDPAKGDSNPSAEGAERYRKDN